MELKSIENLAKSLAEDRGLEYDSLDLTLQDDLLNESLERRRNLIFN